MNAKSTPRKRTIRIILLVLAIAAAFYVGLPQMVFAIVLAIVVAFFPVLFIAAIVGGILALAGVGPLGRAVRRRRTQAQAALPTYAPLATTAPPTYYDPRGQHNIQGYPGGVNLLPAPYLGYYESSQGMPVFTEEDRLNLVEFDPMTAEALDLDWEDRP